MMLSSALVVQIGSRHHPLGPFRVRLPRSDHPGVCRLRLVVFGRRPPLPPYACGWHLAALPFACPPRAHAEALVSLGGGTGA